MSRYIFKQRIIGLKRGGKPWKHPVGTPVELSAAEVKQIMAVSDRAIVPAEVQPTRMTVRRVVQSTEPASEKNAPNETTDQGADQGGQNGGQNGGQGGQGGSRDEI